MRVVDLGRRDATLTELMDDPRCDPARLRRTYAAFRLVNPVVSGWRATYRRLIRPLLSPTETRTLLDVGSGGGDLPRALAGWAARDGLLLEVTGIDPDPRAHDYASSLPSVPGVTFRGAGTADLDERFDFVVSNHVLHHVDDLPGFLADTARLARVLTVHGDISRSRLAYAVFGILGAPFAGTFIRHDGLLSIRRSYTPGELGAFLPSEWRVIPQAPSRLLLVRAGRAGEPAGRQPHA